MLLRSAGVHHRSLSATTVLPDFSTKIDNLRRLFATAATSRIQLLAHSKERHAIQRGPSRRFVPKATILFALLAKVGEFAR